MNRLFVIRSCCIHQKLVMELSGVIRDYIKVNEGKCEIIPGPFAVNLDAGVREYWNVDPLKKVTTVYRYEEDAAPTIIPFDQVIEVGIYSGLSINVSDLLSGW